MGAITIWGILEIGEFNAHRLLVARPQNKPQRVDDRGLFDIVLSNERCKAGLQRELKCIPARAEQAKVLILISEICTGFCHPPTKHQP